MEAWDLHPSHTATQQSPPQNPLSPKEEEEASRKKTKKESLQAARPLQRPEQNFWIFEELHAPCRGS
jgi:hypothetical protein